MTYIINILLLIHLGIFIFCCIFAYSQENHHAFVGYMYSVLWLLIILRYRYKERW